jgi:tetratricopeptide (TPR) repeat protein
MRKIEPPDCHFYEAASGWLGLGNPGEARAELAQISIELRQKADVLELEWAIDATEKNWKAALETARKILRVAPDRCTGWLHQAYALRRVEDGGLQAAWDALFPAVEKFPEESTIPFNLACYACQMNRLDEARRWLQRALEVGEKKEVKEMALHDSDLQGLWEEIKRM